MSIPDAPRPGKLDALRKFFAPAPEQKPDPYAGLTVEEREWRETLAKRPPEQVAVEGPDPAYSVLASIEIPPESCKNGIGTFSVTTSNPLLLADITKEGNWAVVVHATRRKIGQPLNFGGSILCRPGSNMLDAFKAVDHWVSHSFPSVISVERAVYGAEREDSSFLDQLLRERYATYDHKVQLPALK